MEYTENIINFSYILTSPQTQCEILRNLEFEIQNNDDENGGGREPAADGGGCQWI